MKAIPEWAKYTILGTVIGGVIAVGILKFVKSGGGSRHQRESLEVAEDLAENLAPVENEEEVNESAIVAEDQVSEPELLSENINFTGSVQIKYEPTHDQQAIELHFDRALPTVDGKIRLEAKHLTIAPAVGSLDGYWKNDRVYVVKMSREIIPGFKGNIQLSKLPLENDNFLIFPTKTELEFITPNFKVDFELVDYSLNVLTLSAQANYPAAYLINKFGFSLANSGKPTEIKNINVENTSSPFTKRIILKSKEIESGDVTLRFAGDVTIVDKEVNYEREFNVFAAPLKPIEILSAEAVEGASYFSIKVNCRYPDSKRRNNDNYYAQAKECKVDALKARDFVRVEPEVKFSVVSYPNHFRLVGKFSADQLYKVTILQGLPAEYQGVVKKRTDLSVAMPDYKKSFAIKGKARYLPLHSQAELAFESRNINELFVKIDQILPQNIVFWLTGETEFADDRVAADVESFSVPVHGTKNKLYSGQLKLGNFVKQGQGVYQIEVREDENNSVLDRATVVYTDILLTAKNEENKIHVWTRSMTDLAAKSDVEVRIFNRANQMLGKCGTDSKGYCAIDFVAQENRQPVVILATTGADLNYLRFTDVAIEDEKLQRSGKDSFKSADAGLDVFTFTPRGVYRPGESIELAGSVRTSEFSAVSGQSYNLVLKSPRDKVLSERLIKTSDFGSFNYDFPTQKTFETGFYSVELKAGDKILKSHRIQLEEFVPERIDLKISTDGKKFIGKRNVDVDIAADYMFGSPVQKAPYTLRCVLEPAFRKVPNHSDFVTGVLEEKQSEETIQLDAIEGNLSDQGRATASCDFGDSYGNMQGPYVLRSYVSVQEAGSGRSTQKEHRVLVAKNNEFLGLKITKSQGQKISFQVQHFNVDGEKVKSDEQIYVSIHRQEYNWIYGFDPYYGYARWHSEYYFVPEMDQGEYKLKDGYGEFTVDTQESWGNYLVRVTNPKTGNVTEITSYMGYYWYSERDEEGTFATPKPRSPDQLPVAVSKDQVKIGENFAVKIATPFAGQALICAETNQVKNCDWYKAEKGELTATLKAPNVKPNFYVTVVLFKNPKEGQSYVPARAWGGMSVRIDPGEQNMTVKINAPKKIRPGRKLKIDVEAQGKGDLFLAVVDEGILQITQFKTPDPIEFFHRERSLGVQTYETLGWTFADSPSPGGGAYGERASSGSLAPVRLVSFWRPMIPVDGKASVVLDVPPFQGRLRVMAIALGKDKYGAANADVTVADPVVIQPTLPRFLTEGDKVIAKVAVTNTTNEDQNVSLSVASSPELLFTNKAQDLIVKKGDASVVELPFVVNKFLGEVKFDFVARYGNDESRDDITVRILPSTSKVQRQVDLPIGKEMGITELMPKDLRSGYMDVSATYSPILVAKAVGKIEELIDYPYGCVEQTTSKTFPLLVIRDLIRNLKLKKFDERSIDSMVAAGISRVASMQTYEGGFSYWPGGYEVSQWATAYATHMLLVAKEQGYSVADQIINSAIAYMRNIMSSSNSYGRSDWAEPYMAYVLGLAGKHQLGYLRQTAVADVNKYENLEQDFLIMAAMQLAGENRLLDRFVKRKTLYKLAAMSGEGIRGSYYSNRRSRALRLAISESIWPGDIKARSLASKVAEDLQINYWTTQELAWGLIGLVKRQNKIGWPDMADSPELSWNGKEIDALGKTKFASYWEFADVSGDAKVRVEHSDKKVPAELRFTGYAKEHLKPSSDSPLNISRAYYDIEGKKLQLSKVRSGDLVVVELNITNRGDLVENLAVVDRIPAGLEIENPRLIGGVDLSWIGETDLNGWHIDVRDERVGFFGRFEAGRKNIFYLARATSAGTFQIPPAQIEDMYAPEKINVTLPEKMTVGN